MKKRIVLIILAFAVFVLSIVEYAKTFGSYNDGGYAGFYFDTDVLIIMITAFVLLLLSIYQLVMDNKRQDFTKNTLIVTLTLSGFNACYSGFSMLKTITSAVNDLYFGEAFSLSYADVELHLNWLIISGLMFAYLIFNYFEYRKKH